MVPKQATLSPSWPIGIFDSGIGGLTVANAITRMMPGERIIYFGDTAHLPYGEKSAAAVRSFSTHIADFLLEKGCKIIVIACNTASSLAYQQVKKHVGRNVPVINVIDPVVRHVCDNYSRARVGVIGTKGTINSRVYINRIRKHGRGIKAVSLATPLLAPMIEEGFFNNNISRTIIRSYLSKKSLHNLDALILACTHYPLIKKEIKEFYQGKTEVIDSAEIVASHVCDRLKTSHLLNAGRKKLNHKFYVSDYTDSFEKSTRFFFKNEIHLTRADLWK